MTAMPYTPPPWFAVGRSIFAIGDGAICHLDRHNRNRRDDSNLIVASPAMLQSLQLTLHDLQRDKLYLPAATVAAITAAINSALGIKP